MIRKLYLDLQWHDTLGGTKKGLYVLYQAVTHIAKKQDEIIDKLNKLEAEVHPKGGSNGN